MQTEGRAGYKGRRGGGGGRDTRLNGSRARHYSTKVPWSAMGMDMGMEMDMAIEETGSESLSHSE